MTEVHDVTDDRYLATHPEARYMSYHTSVKRKYKDLSSYLRKFRCKYCQSFGNMKAIANDTNPHVISALICSNCNHIFHLDIPIDEQNLGIEKRPELMGRATKMKHKLSESEKLGIDKASRKDSPRNISLKTFLLKDSSDLSSISDMRQIVNKSLRRAGYPIPTQNSIIKSVYDAEDMQHNIMMEGKAILKEKTVYNLNQLYDVI